MADRFIPIKIESSSYNDYKLEIGQFKYTGGFDGMKDLILENIISAYKGMKNDNRWRTIIEEEHFTDLLVDKMKQNPLFCYVFIVNREPKEGNFTNIGYLDIKIDIPSAGRYFAIECKKIDTKTGRSSLRQKYIEDGLSRFINGKYAKEENFGGMIGYVVEGDIVETSSDMKRRVREYRYVQGKEHLLDKTCVSYQGSFQSEHIRENNLGNIHIYHLLFDFEKKDDIHWN